MDLLFLEMEKTRTLVWDVILGGKNSGLNNLLDVNIVRPRDLLHWKSGLFLYQTVVLVRYFRSSIRSDVYCVGLYFFLPILVLICDLNSRLRRWVNKSLNSLNNLENFKDKWVDILLRLLWVESPQWHSQFTSLSSFTQNGTYAILGFCGKLRVNADRPLSDGNRKLYKSCWRDIAQPQDSIVKSLLC